MSTSYVVAVSGGVDSVVLLHMLSQRYTSGIVVAHFDHGIRDNSAEDLEFVRELAEQYGYPFESKRESLGKDASEELARRRRYLFLKQVARTYNARLMTAHHSNDVVETIAINVIRGTGWRGLAAMDSEVERPLLTMTKSEILAYAQQHRLVWHEDSTNTSDAYLRNRIRKRLSTISDDTRLQLMALRSHQVALKSEIDEQLGELMGDKKEFSRYFFICTDQSVALECLRRATKAQLTRPQLLRALLAVKTYNAGTVYHAGSRVQLRFTSRNFVIELIK